MAITIPQGYIVRSPEAIDHRLVLTKDQMKYLSRDGQNGQLPSVYFCICSDDGKLYLYDRKNTYEGDTGRYQVIQTGVQFTIGNGLDKVTFEASDVLSLLANPDHFVFDVDGALKINPDLLSSLDSEAIRMIIAERNRAMNSEAVLEVAISDLNNDLQTLNTEIVVIENSVNSLDAQLQAEIARAQSSEAVLNAAIAAESARAQAAEIAERQRAMDSEANIRVSITALDNAKQDKLTAGDAIDISSADVKVKYDNQTIKLNAGNLKVALDGTSLSSSANGIKVNFDDKTIKLNGSQLAVNPGNATLVRDNDGLKVNLDNATLKLDNGNIKVQTDSRAFMLMSEGISIRPDDSLQVSASGVGVNFDKVQKKLVVDPGLRLTSEATRDRLAVLYDGLLNDNSETLDIRNGHLYVKDVLYAGPTSAKGTLRQIIPSSAGTDRIAEPGVKNDLVTHDQLMDAISANLGAFRGTFASEAALEAAFPKGAADKNDYAFVTHVTSEGTFYDRYKCTDTAGNNWEFEFRIATSAFTADQWKALESMATKEDIQDFAAHIQDVVPQTAKTAPAEAYKLTHDTQGHITSSTLYNPDWAVSVTNRTVANPTTSNIVKTVPLVRQGTDTNKTAVRIASGNASGVDAVGEGRGTASGDYSHAEGNSTTASGGGSHAEGYSSRATAQYSHAEGASTLASANQAHAEGQSTTASGQAAHAEGNGTSAAGLQAHAEGLSTTASGNRAHAEGQGTVAEGPASHAEGCSTIARGRGSHAEGAYTEIKNDNIDGAHVEGTQTIATTTAQHVQGMYNVEDTEGLYADIVGWGSETTRKNISSLTKTGDLHIKQDFYFQSDNDGKNGYKLPYNVITETGTGTKTLALAKRDHIYIYPGPITKLTVTAIEKTDAITDIIFKAGTSITVTLPTGVKLPSGFSGFEANKTYEINILYNLATVTAWE